jgi:outer membrane lipoprotein SlyB
MKKILAVLALPVLLAACATPSQDVYDFSEAGQSTLVEFGTVLKVRDIEIKGGNSGGGALAGGLVGAGAGSAVGGGDGRAYTALGGAVIGAVAGGLAEQALKDKRGVEYTIVTEKGKIITIPQYTKKEEPIFGKGSRVMVQTSGSYQRVLKADDLPETVKRPKGIKVVD